MENSLRHLIITISNVILIQLVFSISLFSQSNTGKISGTVLDSETGEKIIGANIIVLGTTLGDATDLEGRYTITGVPSGTYNIRASFISYASSEISNVTVTANKTTELDISLVPEAISVEEVVVLDRADLAFEAALLNQQRKSSTISDGLSAESIRKTADANTAEALRRVSGITLMDDKFIFVRGTSERYSGALLNNAPIASSEPDKKSFAFDLIPSSLIENTVVVKSFTPDTPGDFSGGVVKINTVDFPSRSGFTFSYSTGYISDVTTKTFRTYDGGGLDFLGIDDGTRDLPGGFPGNLFELRLNRDTLYKSARTLKNNWSPKDKSAPLNHSFSLNYSDIFSLFGSEFGLVSSLAYKIKHFSQEVILKDRINEEEFLYEYGGSRSNMNVFWGGIVNLSYKLSDYHKVSLKNSVSINSDDEVVELAGKQYDRSSFQTKTGFRFVERSLYSGQLMGESYLPFLFGSELAWRFSYSRSVRNEPDYRQYTYGRDLNDPDTTALFMILPYVGPDGDSGARFFSELDEDARGTGIDLTLPVGSIKFKIGGSYDNASRSFNSRLIGMLNQSSTNFNLWYYDIDSIFAPENFNLNGFTIGEFISGTNNYTAFDEVSSFYGMLDLAFGLFGQETRIIGGARLENYAIRLRTFESDKPDVPLNVDDSEHDLLPSVNLIFSLFDASNIRFAYSNTVNRPEFREFAPFSYYDFQIQGSIKGNPNLKTAKVTNFDVRYEIFPNIGELVSVSGFYKEIVNPIEKVVLPASNNNIRSFENASFARLWGFEVETRTSLGYLTNLLSDFYLRANYAWIKSEVDEPGSGSSLPSIRPLQGQSPYTINIALNYINPYSGTDVSLLYYKFGDRVVTVASHLNDDIIEESRNLLDLVIRQRISSIIEVKLSVKDILAEDEIYKESGELLRYFQTQPEYSLGFTLKL